MYTAFELAKKYIGYWLNASNGKGHGVHSPFVFEFIIKVLNDKQPYEIYKSVEQLRSRLKKDKRVITIEDFGAGSRVDKTFERSVQQIASRALKPKKFGQLLYRIIKFYKPENVLELGTSLGITTSYLASGNSNAILTTIEGSTAIAHLASENFKHLQLAHIKQLTGNFDIVLPEFLSNTNNIIDLAFIDGNHRKTPTLQYFQQLLLHINNESVLIFDDIHWSKEMEEAWEEIKENEAVTLTIDLFFIGLVFFRTENKSKQHFVIRF